MADQTPAQNAAALPDGTPREHGLADTLAITAIRAQQATAASLLAVAGAIIAHTQQQHEGANS